MPPAARAALWLSAVAVMSGLAVAGFADMDAFLARAAGFEYFAAFAATLATGGLAVFAAFQLTTPGRSSAWMLVPLPTLALWFACVAEDCLESWERGISGQLFEAAECIGFLLAVSAPLAVSVLLPLYRTRPAAPVRVAAMAGLGVSALAASLLHFFHPFAPTAMDVAAHGLAMFLVIAASAWSPRLVSSV